MDPNYVYYNNNVWNLNAVYETISAMNSNVATFVSSSLGFVANVSSNVGVISSLYNSNMNQPQTFGSNARPYDRITNPNVVPLSMNSNQYAYVDSLRRNDAAAFQALSDRAAAFSLLATDADRDAYIQTVYLS